MGSHQDPIETSLWLYQHTSIISYPQIIPYVTFCEISNTFAHFRTVQHNNLVNCSKCILRSKRTNSENHPNTGHRQIDELRASGKKQRADPGKLLGVLRTRRCGPAALRVEPHEPGDWAPPAPRPRVPRSLFHEKKHELHDSLLPSYNYQIFFRNYY